MQAGLEAGELVVILPEHAGRNACTALHPRAWVERHMLDGFELREYAANGAAMNGGQDLYLLRRLSSATPADRRQSIAETEGDRTIG